MTRRVHLDNLRKVDPVTLDIMVQDALRRPLVQLSAATIADLMALAHVEAMPKPLRRALQLFSDRMCNELVDLPSGEPLDSLIGELDALPPGLVPTALREGLAREVANPSRPEIPRKRMANLLEAWQDHPPETVQLGAGRPVIHRVKTQPAEEPRRVRAAPASRPSSGATATAPKPARAAPTKFVDEVRQRWLMEQVLERLSDYLEQGLREDVLVAGIRHRARADYPDMAPHEVTAMLRDLEAGGRIRHSAGRWRRVLGSW